MAPGVLHPVGMWQPRPSYGTVTVSGETVDQSETLNKAGIAFYGGNASPASREGDVFKIENTTYTQVDATTDWVRPTASAGAGYHIRATITSDIGGDPGLSSGSSATGTWINMTTANEVDWFVTALGTGGADNKDITLTIAISDDGGSTTLDSASYRLISGYF